MSDEQTTKLETQEQPTNQEPNGVTNPEQGREPEVNPASEPAQEPSTQPSQANDPQAAIRAMGEAQRAAAEERAKREYLEQQLQAQQQQLTQFQQTQQQQADPRAKARADYLAARENFDANAELDALTRINSLEAQRIAQEAEQRAIQRMTVQSQIPEAGQMMGITDPNAVSHTLTNVASSLTPAELALVHLHRNNKLDGYVAQRKAAQAEEQQRAQFFSQLGEPGGGRSVPGQSAQSRVIAGDYWDWTAASPEARQRERDRALQSGKTIVLEGAPDGYDAMTEYK